jgi:hypothetical protein
MGKNKNTLWYVLSIVWLLIVSAFLIVLANQEGDWDWGPLGFGFSVCGILPVALVAFVRWAARAVTEAQTNIGCTYIGGGVFVALLLLLVGVWITAFITERSTPTISAECPREEIGVNCAQLTVSNTSSSEIELELTGRFELNGATPKGKWQVGRASDLVLNLRPGTYRVTARCGLVWDTLDDVTVRTESKISIIAKCY